MGAGRDDRGVFLIDTINRAAICPSSRESGRVLSFSSPRRSLQSPVRVRLSAHAEDESLPLLPPLQPCMPLLGFLSVGVSQTEKHAAAVAWAGGRHEVVGQTGPGELHTASGLASASVLLSEPSGWNTRSNPKSLAPRGGTWEHTV